MVERPRVLYLKKWFILHPRGSLFCRGNFQDDEAKWCQFTHLQWLPVYSAWRCHSQFLVGGFNPFEKNISQNWIISPGRGENKKYVKPPPRFYNGQDLGPLLKVEFFLCVFLTKKTSKIYTASPDKLGFPQELDLLLRHDANGESSKRILSQMVVSDGDESHAIKANISQQKQKIPVVKLPWN